MVGTQAPRVDPRPVKPPTMGLLASGNNVVVGGDSALDEPVNVAEKLDVAGTGRVHVPITDGDAADWETPTNGRPVRWINGFAFVPEVCNGGDIIAPDAGTPGTPPGFEDQVDVHPYVVEGADQRSTMGTPQEGDYDEARGYARRQLLGCEPKQIEHELWTGKLTNNVATGNRHLTSPTVDLVEGDRLLGYITALAALERAIKDGTCGQQGMIHARADTISIWDAHGALRRVGNLILTIHDTVVVPGAGYDGTAPDAGTVGLDVNHDNAHAGGHPSLDSAWAYATGIVDIRRGAIFPPQHLLERLNTQENILTTYARRTAAAAWGCLHAGVHVDHVNEKSTTGS